MKTTSPTWVPEAPKDLAFHIEPSSSTNLASDTFQGLSAKPKPEQIRLHEFWGTRYIHYRQLYGDYRENAELARR